MGLQFASVNTNTAILLAGPTASGKSRRAMELARKSGGVVVNADAMQVYRELRVLTARPSVEDEAAVPHRLYGHVPAATRYSVGAWLTDVSAALAAAREDGKVPIVVGGTGLYFKAMTEGLAAIPPIPPEVRAQILVETEAVATEALYARLAATDPEDAAAVRPSDRARILRALEVFEATGRSLLAWRSRPARPLVDPARVERMVIEIDRAELHARIAERAEAMVREGAIEEARALGGLGLSPDLPAMKAIGVRQFLDHEAGKLSLAEAIATVKTETRRYAKRQMTWLRHQMKNWPRVPGDAV
jgi:tRNA dimethylallyltransferase